MLINDYSSDKIKEIQNEIGQLEEIKQEYLNQDDFKE